ncbi:MAG: alanine/ornithine racemase family PLP-dependent enzyme [Thermoplasmata archaeon]|nr:alanine/ornithine racemase family PLP-dependent enzyme [Thermoplasmata archaeon]
MAKYPRILIDLDKIRQNAKSITDLASKFDIEVTGVTKATCGDPLVAKAMLDGGVVSIADSRMSNIRRMKDADVDSEFLFLRTPMLSQAEEVVRFSDMSLNTEMDVVKELDKEAERLGTEHKIVIMLEMGELREGINIEDSISFIESAMELENIEIYGIGINLACLSGVIPTKEKMADFGELVKRLESRTGVTFKMVGGGNSANIPLLLKGISTPGINNLRIGEAILLGLETVNRCSIPGTYQDAFVLQAEIIEVNKKPSVPDGKISQNAFGETLEFEDKGIMRRGILALGRQDVIVESLRPLDNTITIESSSSDHIVVDLTNTRYKLGDKISFLPGYGALVHAFTSKFVKKEYLGGSS